MFEGIIYRDRNNPKPPDVVFANGKLSKIIYPNNFVHIDEWVGWHHHPLPFGENGIYLVVNADGQEISKKLTFSFYR